MLEKSRVVGVASSGSLDGSKVKQITEWIQENAEDFIDYQTDQLKLTELENALSDDLDLDIDDQLSFAIWSILDALGYIEHSTSFYAAEIQ